MSNLVDPSIGETCVVDGIFPNEEEVVFSPEEEANAISRINSDLFKIDLMNVPSYGQIPVLSQLDKTLLTSEEQRKRDIEEALSKAVFLLQKYNDEYLTRQVISRIEVEVNALFEGTCYASSVNVRGGQVHLDIRRVDPFYGREGYMSYIVGKYAEDPDSEDIMDGLLE